MLSISLVFFFSQIAYLESPASQRLVGKMDCTYIGVGSKEMAMLTSLSK